MRIATNYTHQTERNYCGSSRTVLLPIQHTRIWPICAHCLETEFGVCRQSSNGLRVVWILHLFFFWGAAKAEMFKEKPFSFRQLKQAVESFTQSLTTDTCGVNENFAVRINACANRNGAHIENTNYKTFA